MAIESADISSASDVDEAIKNHSEKPIENDSNRQPASSQKVESVKAVETKEACHLPESLCRRLHLPAMEDSSERAEEERLSTVGGWVRSLSFWIDAVSEGCALSIDQGAAVEGLKLLLEDGCLVIALSALAGHKQVGVQEYAAEILGRLYIAPLMEAQAVPATRAARLKGLMNLMQRDGAIWACIHLLSAASVHEDLEEAGGGYEERAEAHSVTPPSDARSADASGAETVLPCTVLAALNCLQSIVTFHPDALSDAGLCLSLVRALLRTARCATAAAYRRALSSPRAAAAVPLLCGGRTAAEAAGAEDEGQVWAWEVRESAGMTLAQVRCPGCRDRSAMTRPCSAVTRPCTAVTRPCIAVTRPCTAVTRPCSAVTSCW